MGSHRLGFTLETPLINLEIVLEELTRLHIHEEIIPEKMKELVEKIPDDGVWIHPIIVDRNSLVVLDGMHRVAAAKEIGYRYIPVCLVDYENPNIHIGCWYRMFKNLNSAVESKQALIEAGLIPIVETYDKAQTKVETRKVVSAFFSKTWCYTALGPETDIKRRYDIIKKVENIVQASGYRMGYATDRDAPARIASGEYSSGLMSPMVTKKEVVDIALKGMVFSQKTTRHIIPARPMFVTVPTEWLNGDLDLHQANSLLRKHLASKNVEKLPPGQILDRRYDEELYVFR